MKAFLLGNVGFNASEFDLARWDHWLLLVTFMTLSVLGLWLSWRSHQESRQRRRRRRLTHQPVPSRWSEQRYSKSGSFRPGAWQSSSGHREAHSLKPVHGAKAPTEIPTERNAGDRPTRKLHARKSRLRQYR